MTKYIPVEPTIKQTVFLLLDQFVDVMYGGATGGGKILDLDNVILTPTGWRQCKDLRLGDVVCSPFHGVTFITNISPTHTLEQYVVRFKDGTSTNVAREHLWSAWQHPKDITDNEIGGSKVISTAELMTWSHKSKQDKHKDDFKPCIPLTNPVSISRPVKTKVSYNSYYEGCNAHKNNDFLSQNLFSVPNKYKVLFIRGIFDTIGVLNVDNSVSVTLKGVKAYKYMLDLFRSQGFYVFADLDNLTLTCFCRDLKEYFSVPEKLNKAKNLPVYKEVESVEIEGTITGRCITVMNKNGLYITNDYIVTHNSVALLMAALQYVDYPHYNAIILRQSFADLALPNAVLDLSKQWLMNTDAKWTERAYTWRFPSGARLSFGFLENPNDHFRYQGAEFQFIGLDEVTQLRWTQVLYMFSRLRRNKYSTAPLRFRCACNPGGRSHEEVKDRYIKYHEGITGVERLFVPSTLMDNPHLNQKEYSDVLDNLDYITRVRYKYGDWDITEEGGFFKFDWFDFVDSLPDKRQVVSSVRWWDLASTPKENTSSKDFTAGAKLSLTKDGIVYIEDIIHIQKSAYDVEQTILEIAEKDGIETIQWMEQEPGSSGRAVCDHYARNILRGFPFYHETSTGKKDAYVKVLSSATEHGYVKIFRNKSWNNLFINEALRFPFGDIDDMIDSVSKAYCKLTVKKKTAGVWSEYNGK